VRTLPLRLAPIDEESLPGYLHRYACTFGISPQHTLRLTGVLSDKEQMKAAGHYPLRLSDEQVARFCAATALDPERLARMLLSRFEGTAFIAVAEDEYPRARVRTSLGRAVSLWKPRACPDCLREDGAWRLRWLLRWSVVCPRHERLLLSLCPGCRRPLRLGTWGQWPRDDRGPEQGATSCWHSDQGRVCRYPLEQADAPHVDGDELLLVAQRRIDRVLEREAIPMLAGKEYQPYQYLRDLVVLVRLVQEEEPLPSESAWEPSEQLTSNPYRTTLSDAARVAQALPRAIAMADAPDPDALCDSLRALTNRRHAASGLRLPNPQAFTEISPLLREAIMCARNTASYGTVSARLRVDPRVYRRPADLHPDLEARHVPQLYWHEDYERELAQLFRLGKKFSASMARRFCSVLLARMLTPASWENASHYLGLPLNFQNKSLQGTLSEFIRHGSLTELMDTIKRTASDHAASGTLVDYEQRRAHLATWQGIDETTLYYCQPATDQGYDRLDLRHLRAHASIWLWCELTSGHASGSPHKLPSSRERYRRFKTHHVNELRERLLLLGQLILDTPADARSSIGAKLIIVLTQRGLTSTRTTLDERSNYMSYGKVA
jgi:hypothetical protein